MTEGTCSVCGKYGRLARGYCNMHYKRWRKTGDPGPPEPQTNRIPGTYEERFWARVEKTETCWNWTGSSTSGYGNMWDGKRMVYAHRYAYELLVGPIPDGLMIDHLCRNRRCVNPEHLEPVTNEENILRGESPTAKRARQTHCKRGHPLSGENLYVTSRGYRHCRECMRIAQRTPEAKARRNARLRQRARELGHWPN